MNDQRFQEAKQAYDAGDFRSAVKGFVAAAGSEVEGSGVAYHMAGNALMRLRKHSDAVMVYTQALKDELYDRRGALRSNLAAAHVVLAEYPQAVEEYEAALEEPDYTKQYRALQGLAGALFEMKKYTEAAGAYRQAALDGDNPDPGKALNNLGLCFMAMGRPGDAVEAYRAALGFDTYDGRGKALANLGIAYCAMEDHDDAVKSFKKALELHGHELSEQARDAYGRSEAALAQPERVIVDGWSTGELPPVFDDDDPGFTDGDLMAAAAVGTASASPATKSVSPTSDASGGDPSTTGELFGDLQDDSEFFTRTDDEMRDQDRAERKQNRRDRLEERNPWTLVATIVLIVIVIVATLAAIYFSGLGFPTQTMTVNDLLEAHGQGEAVDSYWVAVPAADVDREMAKLPPMQEYQIGDVDRSPRTSSVAVTVTPEDGSPLSYEITLAREGVGWKITGIENYWRSSSDDS